VSAAQSQRLAVELKALSHRKMPRRTERPGQDGRNQSDMGWYTACTRLVKACEDDRSLQWLRATGELRKRSASRGCGGELGTSYGWCETAAPKYLRHDPQHRHRSCPARL